MRIRIICKDLLDGYIDVTPSAIHFVRKNLTAMKKTNNITEWSEYEVPYLYYSIVDDPSSWIIACMGKLSNHCLE